MANCTVNDLILSFDKEDRLRNTIGRVTGFDINKAYVLASFMQDEKFKKFLFDNLTEDDFLNGTFVSKENFTENDYVNIKQNKLGALLNIYYINTYHSVNNSKTNKSFGGLNGFSTGTAKAEAKKHTAVMIIQEYRKRFVMPTKENEERSEIIKDVIETVNRKILHHFYDEVDKFAQNVLSSKKYSKAAKEYAKSYIELVTKSNDLYDVNITDAKYRNEVNETIRDLDKRLIELNKSIKKLEKEGTDNVTLKNQLKEYLSKKTEKEKLVKQRDDANKRIASRNKETSIMIRDKYVIAQNLVNLYTDNYDAVTKVTLRNYANLVAQTRGNIDNWYFQVFNTKAMTSLTKEFGNIDNLEAYMEQQDTNNDEVIDKYNGESIDETAKTWEDHLYTNFNQIINGRLRMILSTIPKLSQPYNYNSEVQAHDINNELGVTTFMDAQFVTNQIFTFGDFSSVDALIDSLEKKSRTVKSLYGIGQIVNMMKNDRCFANYVYANFAKPIVHKTILTISDDIKFDYSNPNAFHTTSLVFNMINKLKTTYNTAYNSDNEILLDNIAKAFKDGKYSRSVTNEYKEKLYNILAIYFPNFDKDVFNNYFDNNKESNHIKANLLISFLKDINRYLKPLKQQINEEDAAIHKKNNDAYLEYKKYQKEYWSTLKSERDKMKVPVKPDWEYIDYSKFKFSDNLTSSIIGLAKLMSDFTESKARLNTTNAEGNAASDVIKNCFVTRFFDQIMAESEKDSQAGLKALLSFITQGAETTKDDIKHANQYSNNPLFFGLKDENGKVIYPGMFTRTATGYDINKHAKEILKYNLFDGTKNVSEKNGVGYASMSKTDFFITEYMAYEQSTEEIINDKRDTGTGYGASGVYPMRIGSDAPKIFFIRAPKYTRKEVQYAFYNHLMNELTMFCNGLSNIMQDDGTGRFTTIKDIDGLLGRAFFHEKTADSIKQNNGTDFTKAITDGKRLRGNLFDFKRLFEVNGYKAGAEIESVLHLYGQDGLFIANKDGSLSLNSQMIAKKDDTTSNAVNPLLTYDGTRFAFNLSENQKKTLLDIVDKWMTNFVADASLRTNDFIEVLKKNKIPYTTDRINMFFLNSANMNMNYDDLFEGDYKYYNNARDFLKRTKETQAGGDGYAGYDLLDDGRSGIKELKWQGKKDVIGVQSYTNSDNTESSTMENVTVDGTPLIARNGWKAVTIYNTNKPSDYAQEMQVKLESIFIEHDMQPELAKSKSVAIAKGYGFSAADRSGSTTKINDAQSYITLEEFIRRKYADGTLQDYADLIKQLTDSTPVENIDIDKINARIQVQKNFYYDKVYDAKTNQFYPRQIKNAEYVLIPKLIKGTELEKVYNFMQKNGIGQLNTAETSKAAKKNVFTIWDAETGKFDENFESKYKPTYAEDYFYKNLYKQQDVPQHMVDAMNKAGSQIMKKIIDNIFNEIEANNERRKELIKAADNFQRAYTQNIKESFEEFLDNMGWAYDESTGQIVNAEYAIADANGDKLPDDIIKTNRETLNFSQFYIRARQEAARLGMDSNFMDYLTTNEFGVPLMPNCMNVVMNKLESVAQSIYNRKITRQELPGWHAAQITNVGYSKKLQFDAKTGVMQVLLPRWSKLIPRGKNAEEDAAILKQLETEGLDIHIGYRIPTEGKQSIAVLKVVGFVNDCLGSTIVVPDDWVTQTGSDFDVDSVYGISWEMYSTTKKGKIELHKVEYKEDEVDNRKLYIRYVLNKIDNKIPKDDLGKEISTKMKELRDSIMEASQEEFTKASEEFDALDKQRNELFNELPAWARGIIKDLNFTIKVEDRKNRKKWHDLNDLYTRITEKLNNYLDKHSDKLNEEDVENVKQYIDLMDGLIRVLNLQKDIISNDKEEFQSSKGDAIQEILDNAINRKVEKAEEKAKEAGVISYKEFLELPFVERLTRKARNNYIIEQMLTILNDDTSREEQYGRSNFEKITNGEDGANDIIDEISGEKSRIRNPYNPLDQLDYFEDAMGGARLKALSVNWDTFISRNNKVRAELSDIDAIDVVMVVGEKSADDSVITYDEQAIRESYGDDIIDYEEYKTARNELNTLRKEIKSTNEKEIINAIDKNEGRVDAKETVKALNTNSELTDEERDVIKNKLGNKPRVLVASEATDPVFHYKYFKNLVENELKKPSIDREFHMMYIITKHDGIPLKELAELKIPKFIHFSITSLGGTKYEPGVMKMDDLLDRIETFIKDGTLNPDLVTIRIDPIIPGVTKQEDIRHIIKRSKAMGIKQFKFSIMDSYGTKQGTDDDRFVIEQMQKAGYDWDTYYDVKYGKYVFHAKKEYIDAIYKYMDDIAEELNVNMWTCGEKYNLPLKRVRTNIGCLNSESVNKALGITAANEKGNQRGGCNCLSGKVNKLSYNAHCSSGCIYCYAKHGSNSYMKYYDDNGNLLDNDYTRTVKKIKIETSTPKPKDNKKRIIYRARKLGWSKNNRNTVGELITTYASQTTAHHLDAVKMGSVPNVNEYTFGVYKLLSSVGIDYETVIGFMRQPAITKIINNNNLINSVFFKSNNDPIRMALTNLAIDFKLSINGKAIDEFSKTNDIIDAFKNDSYISEAFENIFGIDIYNMATDKILYTKIPLDKEQLFDRIKSNANRTGNVYENAAFDLAIILTFTNFKRTANKINKYINATNVDKFGAKPSIRETRKHIELVEELRNDMTLFIKEEVPDDIDTKDIYDKEGRIKDRKRYIIENNTLKRRISFIDLVFPKIVNNIIVGKSEYPSIAAVHKYAALTSFQTSKKLFITEDDDFARLEKNIQNIIGHIFSEGEYKEYKKYTMTYLYNKVPVLLSPIRLTKNGNIIINQSELKDLYWDKERSRIYGYGIATDGDFKIENVNEPTEEELEKYYKLTPAQKVLFMQRHFPDNQGIFNYLKVTLLNPSDANYRGINRQYISYDDQIDSIEDLYIYFVNSFSNHNPLIKLAAMDLIKYAFIAEGFNFKSGYITKVIQNSPLYTSIKNGGTNITDYIKRVVENHPYKAINVDNNFINNFVRSHSNITNIVRMGDLSNGFLNLSRLDGLIHIDATTNNETVKKIITKLNLGKNIGHYIRINFFKGYNKLTNKPEQATILFEVIGDNYFNDETGEKYYQDYFLVPLNELDSYETYDYSYNQRNNRFASIDYYKDVIKLLAPAAKNARTEIKKQNIKVVESIRSRVTLEANKNIPAKFKKVGAYKPEIEFDLNNDPYALMHAMEHGDSYTRDSVKKLINGAIDYFSRPEGERYKAYIQYNPAYQLNKLIPKGTTFDQIIDTENETYKLTIIHLNLNQKHINNLKDKINGISEAKEFETAIEDIKNQEGSLYANHLYRVSITKTAEKELKENARKAATDLAIDDTETAVHSPRRGIISADDVSSAIISEINYNARKNSKEMAKRFMNEMNRHRVNRFVSESREQNRKNIYKSAARYYKSVANEILNKLNKFELGLETYSMDDPKMYEALAEHSEQFGEVADILLNGMTFGNRIETIFKLDLAVEDRETKEAIEEIINSINSVRQNTKLKHAMDNMINIYFQKYSTNPYIMSDFINLREAFGDLDVIDSWFTNPADIENSEVQTIVKQVYAMFSKAEMFDVERNIKEYKEELEKVKAMNDSMDINKVIDFKNFKIRQGYNEQFLEDRQKVFDEYNEASVNKNNSSEDFAKYLRAKYARDKFMYENTEQRIEDEYYRRDLEMRDEVMRKAGDLYVQYMMLTNQLYNNNSLILENDEEASNRKRVILGKLKMLKSNVDEVGSEKSPDVLVKVNALNKFLKERSKLQEEYFETKEYEGFAENYERYNNIVKHYNETHSQEPLDKRLENAEYREAYDWIKNNGSLKFGKEESEKLRKAFKALTRRTTVFSNDTLTKLRKVEGLIDEAGQIDGRKLNDAQLKELHDEENSDLARAYDNGEGEIMLLKNVPGNIPIMKYIPSPFAGNLNAEQQRDLKKKKELIGKINKIIGKAYDRNTNSINLNILFNNDIVSFDERKELSDLYEELYNLGSEYKKRYWSAIKEKINKKRKEQGFPVKEEPYDELTYDKAFNADMLYYKQNLMNTADGTLFLRIFCDKNGKANPYIYGYKMPKNYFIDTERTEAAKYINENVDFVPNEYYYLAMNEASENGTFDEWFKANHVYNPYTHKYQPLKIWTKLEAKPGSALAESISYVPTFENMERNVKEDKINKKYKEFSTNYKKGNSKYDSNVTLNAKEEALRTLLTNIMNKYATTYQGKRFVGQGYLPRERKNEIDTRWVLTQTAALFGASWHSGADSDSFHRQVDFAHDREAEMNMLTLIKGKGYQEYKHIPPKGTMTDEEYAKKLKEVREENRKIKEENEKVDVKNLNTNWEEVMEHFIHNATIFNSRQAAKPYLYLLLEDLKGNDAYAIKGRWNKRVLRDDAGTMTTPQTRTREIVHTLTRRLLFEQHHENSTPRTIANFLQNLTSAKYMIFNAYGGVANVTTGLVNIDMENQANEYFGYKEFMSAEKEYLSNILGIISNLYSDTAGSLTQAFIKQFNIVNFDDVLQFGSGSMNLDETLRKVRNWGYSFQSAGEHYMQNSVLLAMLKSNRLFTDHRGYRRIGDFKDYSWNIEQQAMFDVLKGNDELYTNYDLYLKSIKYDVDEKLNIVTNRKDYNRNYLYSLRDSIDENTQNLYKKVAKAYHKRREELLKEARTKFNEFDTVESLYDFKDGKAVLKKEKVDNFNKQGKNPIGDLEHLIAEFREKVISVNQKIHGVYDKKGAAQIETKWWGSIIMQYHKHLWTGIMKRWRRRGYYSEFRGSQERGSYQTFIDFLGTEFTNFKGRVKNKQEQGENEALASIQVAMTSIINSLTNIGFNWHNLSEWERANMKRNLGDMKGILVACLVVMALYGLYDDDDIKDDTFKSSLLYLADRLYSDSSMYSPIGLASEYKTAWSSPIASANGPSDLLKAMMLIPKALFDPEYDPKYQSGQYAGENKLMVLLRRNIPGVRPYDRIEHITKNNQYYKIGNSQIGVNIFKNFGEALHE